MTTRTSGRHRKPTPAGRYEKVTAMLLRLREPALITTLAGITIKLIGAWIDLGIEQQALLNALVAAVVGVIIHMSTRDGQSAAILGAAQALIALVIGFGLRVDPDTQAMIMSAVGLAIGMYDRTQVIAPVQPPA